MPTPVGVATIMAGPRMSGLTTKRVGATLASWGVLRGYSMGAPTSIDGFGHFGRHIVNGIVENFTEGSPASPCLQVTYPNTSFRFRWSVKAGSHSVSVLAKQVANVAPFPSIVVRANAAIGVSSDITAFASGGTGWSTIGPITITATATGVLWVEFFNNCVSVAASPAFFDHVVLT